jgi:Rha family phage regulatory protein
MTNVTTTTGTTTSALTTFAPELTNINGQITTTSAQVAQHFGKTHKSVLRAIRNLGCSPEYHQRNFAPMVVTVEIGSGATREDPAYRLTRDGFVSLAMGFTGQEAWQWKEAYILAFNKMEAELVAKVEAQPERIAYSVNPNDTLSASQAEELRIIFKTKCDTLPKDNQAAFMIKAWSKMKSHFGVTYRKIPQREYSEAVSLATRHASEWDALPAPAPAPVQALPAPTVPITSALITGLVQGGMINQRALIEMGNAIQMQLFVAACGNPDCGLGYEIASKVKTMSPADLYTVNVAANMEVWLRTLQLKTA